MFIALLPLLAIAFFALSKDWFVGLGILIGVSALDAILFAWLPSMWVCYGCQSEFRGAPKEIVAGQKPFDHHTAERYRLRKFLLKP